jgi:hypothetical protein
MKASEEDIIQGKQHHKRFSELASGRLLYIKMLKNTTEPTMYAKELRNLPEEI